jgi:hypothetical protein
MRSKSLLPLRADFEHPGSSHYRQMEEDKCRIAVCPAANSDC